MVTSSGPGAAPSSTAGSGRRLDSLTGLRWFAALAVFFAHVAPSAFFANPQTNLNLNRIFEHGGGAAVSFFFILSGFVLTVSLRKTDTAGRFVRRRLVKIFPNHIVTWAVATFFVWQFARSVSGSTANLFLVQAWVPKPEVFSSPNFVAWTLSCELLFYVTFPFIIRPLQRIRPERLWFWTLGTVAAVFAAVLFAVQVLPSSPQLQAPALGVGIYQYWFVYVFPVTRLLEFVLGILVARLVLNGRWIRIGVLPAAALVLAAYVLTDMAPPLLSLTAIMALPMALLIGTVGWNDLRGRRSWLASRPMVWLGEISFAFYLVHINILGIRTKFPTTAWGPLDGALVVLAALLVTIAASALLFYVVERPLVRRFSSPRPRRAAVADPATTT